MNKISFTFKIYRVIYPVMILCNFNVFVHGQSISPSSKEFKTFLKQFALKEFPFKITENELMLDLDSINPLIHKNSVSFLDSIYAINFEKYHNTEEFRQVNSLYIYPVAQLKTTEPYRVLLLKAIDFGEEMCGSSDKVLFILVTFTLSGELISNEIVAKKTVWFDAPISSTTIKTAEFITTSKIETFSETTNESYEDEESDVPFIEINQENESYYIDKNGVINKKI